EDGRIIVARAGTLTLRTADTFDTGLYHCIGTNDLDADALTFRLTVLDPAAELTAVNGAQLSTFVGATLYLPCTSTATPDAAVSWVLPEHVVLHHSAGNRHIFDNGTLRIEGVTERDHGYFRCVAANQYGVDLLVFQVLVRKDQNPPEKKHVRDWEEGDGSGNAVPVPAAAQEHPLPALAALPADPGSAASAPSSRVPQRAREGSSPGEMTARRHGDSVSRRFRGHRRQFVSSARRVDPQRWAAFLEKTKRNSTLIEKRGEVAAKPPSPVPQVPGDEEEASGDLVSPEDEFMLPVTELVAVPALGTTSSPLARKTSLRVTEAVTPLPSPFASSVSTDSRRPQTHPEPTVTDSWERPGVNPTSGGGVKQSVVPEGAGRASAPAGQAPVLSEDSDELQHLKSVSAAPLRNLTGTSRPVTSPTAVARLHVVPEPGEIPTRASDQTPAVAVSEPSPGFGHAGFQDTPKQVTPRPALASTTITHQQSESAQAITARTARVRQQHGGRRKISGRRRIARPGRVPGRKEHRYNFRRPGSARGSAAVAPDVPLSTRYVSCLPALHNSSCSISPSSAEAPLSPPSVGTGPLEQPGAGARADTAFPRGEESQASAAPTAGPVTAAGTRDTPRWQVETSAPFQTTTGGVQPSSMRPPAPAGRTAHAAAGRTRTASAGLSPTLESVTPSTEPGASPKNSQQGKFTWEHLFGSDAQQEVLTVAPGRQTDAFPSTEVSAMLPESTMASSVSRASPWHLTPVAAGGNHSGGFSSAAKPTRGGDGRSAGRLPATELRSYSSLAPRATQEMAATGWKPTVTPGPAPQADTSIPRSRALGVGGKRGPRRRRPLKSPAASLSVPAGAAVSPSGSTALPVLTT
ncbi:IGS10 protein, partial [Heliornis fulica]|nr:IGS10 protein [Heliornis fulica]